MVELEEKYTQEIDQERTKYELLREEKNDMEMDNGEEKGKEKKMKKGNGKRKRKTEKRRGGN